MTVWVFDLEANGFLDKADRIHCAVFKRFGKDEVVKFTPENIHELPAFMDRCKQLIGHNILGYDFPLLKKLYGYEYKGKKTDTLIMSRLLNPKRQSPPDCPNKKSPHSVEAWGYRVGRGKPEHEDWEEFSSEMLHRCTEDVFIQELIYRELVKEAAGGNWKDAFRMTFRLFECLADQESYGWFIDKDALDRNIATLERWMRRIDAVITPRLPNILLIKETKKDGEYNYVKKPFLKTGAYSKVALDFLDDLNCPSGSVDILGVFSRVTTRKVNLDSRDELVSYLLSLGWIPDQWNYDDDGNKRSPKLSKDDAFEGIEDKVGVLVAKRQQCKHRKSSLEGLKELIREDGAIPSVINNLAVTGRATHRNIVNIPRPGSFFGKQMRQIFSHRPGKVVVGTDSDACQVRMLAGRMGDPAYIDAIVHGKKEDGTDNHSLTMKLCDLESRDVAKTTLYCLLFGGGDDKLGRSAKKPGQGAKIREILYKGFKGLGELVADLQTQWRKTAKKKFNPVTGRVELANGIIEGLDGRPITVPSEHQLLVYLLQSDESIMMATAYCIAYKRLTEKYGPHGDKWGLLLWMHDEIQIECDPDIADGVGEIVSLCIRDAAAFYKIKCPHLGNYSIGLNWADTH